MDEHEIFFYEVSIKVNNYTKKINVPQSHSIEEKCDHILQNFKVVH